LRSKLLFLSLKIKETSLLLYRILEDLPVPLKRAKRKGIFLLQKEEKKSIELAHKKKILNRK